MFSCWADELLQPLFSFEIIKCVYLDFESTAEFAVHLIQEMFGYLKAPLSSLQMDVCSKNALYQTLCRKGLYLSLLTQFLLPVEIIHVETVGAHSKLYIALLSLKVPNCSQTSQLKWWTIDYQSIVLSDDPSVQTIVFW